MDFLTGFLVGFISCIGVLLWIAIELDKKNKE